MVEVRYGFGNANCVRSPRVSKGNAHDEHFCESDKAGFFGTIAFAILALPDGRASDTLAGEST